MVKKIIGLEKVFNIVDNYTTITFPHSIIITGEAGSGKKLICSYIADKLNLELIDITNSLDEKLLDEIYRSVTQRIYLIDTRKIPEGKQNIFLKFLEEPLVNAHVIVLADNEFSLLTTVINRGVRIRIDKYKEDDLKQFAIENKIENIDKYLGNILRTPGDLLKVVEYDIDLSKVEELAYNMVNHIQEASLSNTLTILDKVNFKDEYSKIDLVLLLRMLYYLYVESFINTGDENKLELSKNVLLVMKQLEMDNRLNKERLFTHLLLTLWQESF